MDNDIVKDYINNGFLMYDNNNEVKTIITKGAISEEISEEYKDSWMGYAVDPSNYESTPIKNPYRKLTYDQIVKIMFDYWGYEEPKQAEYDLIDEC